MRKRGIRRSAVPARALLLLARIVARVPGRKRPGDLELADVAAVDLIERRVLRATRVVSVRRLPGARLDRRRLPAAGYRAPVATALAIGRHPAAGYRAPVATVLTIGRHPTAGYGAPVATALTIGRSCCIILRLRLITTEDNQ